MAKRSGNFVGNHSNKKLKTTNIDDLWGDDLDDNDINDCLLMATQVCEEEVNSNQANVSILPSYNGFKQTSSKKLFTSTQSNPDLSVHLLQPSTSKVTNANHCNGIENGFKRSRSFDSPEHLTFMERKIKKLQEDYVAKEGEISILRMQLKDIRQNSEHDMRKREKGWNEKLNATTKELNAARSELEFKNLEIANMKQKVVEVAKLNNLDASFSATQSPYFKAKQPKNTIEGKSVASASTNLFDFKNADSVKDNMNIQPVLETCCPLEYAIPSSVFVPSKEENYLIDVKNQYICRNTIPFLQNQLSQKLIEKIIRLQSKTTLLDNNRRLGLDYIHYEISELMKCTSQELNCITRITCINKILMVSEQLLYDLYQFLLELQQDTNNENCEDVDVTHLDTNFKGLNLDNSVFSAEEWCEKEMGINVRQSISAIAEILPYNEYLRKYLLNRKPLCFNENEEITRCLPIVKSKLDKSYANNCDYLQLINSTVTVIRKLKKVDNFPGLLSSIIVLLSKIDLLGNLGDSNEDVKRIIENITKEILFSHPNIQVLYYYVELLKDFPSSCKSSSFCLMSCNKKVLKIDNNERIIQYSKDTCFIQIFCVFLGDSILKVKDLKFYFNIVQFLIKIIKHNEKWLHYQEDKYCDCLCKIVKLSVDVIYQTVKLFREEYNCKVVGELSTYRKIFSSGLRMLHILNVKASDLIVKYITTYTHYKDVITSLREHKNILNLSEYEVGKLEELDVTEEIPVLDKKLFDSISLWNL